MSKHNWEGSQKKGNFTFITSNSSPSEKAWRVPCVEFEMLLFFLSIFFLSVLLLSEIIGGQEV